MLYLMAITAGVLFAAGIFMILRRSMVKVLVGILLLGYAANLLLFNAAPLMRGVPPLIDPIYGVPAEYADPVPQALILTAIVISFSVTAFAVVLIRRAYAVTGTGDLDNMHCTDIPCESEEILSDLEDEII
ncbi:MAG: cation:proton antiporter [Chloroflexi bacterium HGW-Chloroflexi-3]|nr:MAG: cation:proton antiporter [Chloroflexi bacterium HGW-Chloroflexi-3]